MRLTEKLIFYSGMCQIQYFFTNVIEKDQKLLKNFCDIKNSSITLLFNI